AVMTMKSLGIAAVAAVMCLSSVPAAQAAPIESACVRSERGAGNRALCGCIQQVANMVLSGSDQRRVAKFLKDPDEAHAVWVSKSRSDDAFWERYKQFGEMAEAYCGG